MFADVSGHEAEVSLVPYRLKGRTRPLYCRTLVMPNFASVILIMALIWAAVCFGGSVEPRVCLLVTARLTFLMRGRVTQYAMQPLALVVGLATVGNVGLDFGAPRKREN